MAKINIFLTGATGYIGGSVLDRLLGHPKAASFKIKALVRSPEKARWLSNLGVDIILGSHSDIAKIKKAASKSDVVFACADADNIDAASAILSGLKLRHETTGQVPYLIHTSGTGVLCDEAWGMHSNAPIFNDADSDQMASIPPSQVHRNVDLLIVEADRQGYVRSYIILPSMIYGVATGRLAQMGIQNSHSIHIPVLIKLGLHRRQGGMVGQGRNLWPNVEIGELVDLYIRLFDAILSNRPAGHGRDGYYFGENGENSLYDVCRAISQALVDLGRGYSPEPTTLSVEENLKYFKGFAAYLGSNARCRANRSRSIGWKPVKTTRDMLASIRPEVEALLKKAAEYEQSRRGYPSRGY